jgi:hypothetical protein
MYRFVCFCILSGEAFNVFFYQGPVAWLSSFAFFTVWSLFLTWLYFASLMMLRPRSKKISKFLTGYSHMIWSAEMLVSLFFWTVLFPFIPPEVTNTPFKHWITYSYHTIPIITLTIDSILHKASYEKHHIKFPIIYTLLYGIVNAILGLFFNRVVYPPLNYKSKCF